MIGGALLGGRYRINGELGSGGMARVYRAIDTVIDRPVAVKLLREQYADDTAARERFLREARSAGRLQHPHIVQVFDVGEDNGRIFLVMPLVEGMTLHELLGRTGRLGIAEGCELVAQVADALDYAHQQGIIHRDVKPGNVLVGKSPGGHDGRGDRWAYLADFGIARAAGESGISATNEVFGTAQYLAPERIQGKPATPASDIYGLGIILFEALAGRPPYQGESPADTAFMHVQQPIPNLRALNPSAPAALVAIVEKALAKDPAQRYQRASELSKALRALVHGGATRTTTLEAGPGTTRLADRPAPKRKEPDGGFSWIWAVAGFLVALLVFGLGLFAVVSRLGQLRPDAIATPVVSQAPATPTVRPAPTITPTATITPQLAIPSVEGLEPAAARTALGSAGLQVREGPGEFHTSIAAGRVIKTNPPAGRSVPRGSTVDLIVSLGPETVALPQVTGLRLPDARNRLTAAGFKVNETFETAPNTAEDVVIAQDPGPGQIQPGATVTLRVSKGRKIQVPAVVGLPEGQARQAIERAGLRNAPYINYQGRDQLPESVLNSVCVGCVLSTAPVKEVWVEPNTEVFLAVRRAD